MAVRLVTVLNARVCVRAQDIIEDDVEDPQWFAVYTAEGDTLCASGVCVVVGSDGLERVDTRRCV